MGGLSGGIRVGAICTGIPWSNLTFTSNLYYQTLSYPIPPLQAITRRVYSRGVRRHLGT